MFGDGRTSVRGGAGISYERNFGNVTFNVIQNPPNYAVVVLNGSANHPIPVTSSNAGPLAGASGSVPLPPTSLRNVDENIRTAQTQFYSLAMEHQLAPNTILSLQYAGARGLHLYDIKNINGLGSGNVFAGDPLSDANGNVALTRLNNQYSNINNRGSNGDSYYHAFNVQFQSTDLHHTGLSLVGNYTLVACDRRIEHIVLRNEQCVLSARLHESVSSGVGSWQWRSGHSPSAGDCADL